MAQAGAVIFNFSLDDKLHFPGQILGGRFTNTAALAHVVDLNLTNSPDSIIKYMVHGGLATFWPEAGKKACTRRVTVSPAAILSMISVGSSSVDYRP